MVISRFLTIRRVLQNGGFKEGQDYQVLDNKRHFGKRPDFGKGRLFADIVYSLSASLNTAIATYFYHKTGETIRFIVPHAIGLPILAGGLKISSKMERNTEKSNLFDLLKTLSQKAEAHRLQGGVVATHAIFTRYGGKTYLLSAAAYEHLKQKKKVKVFGSLHI